MASNQTGACSVTPGSALVTFNSQAVMTNVAAGDYFRILTDTSFFTIASVNASAYTCTLTSRYSNSTYELTASMEKCATSDGTRIFSITLDNTPVIPGTVTFSDGSASYTELFSDNADGTLTGDLGGSGTISYDDGVVALTFNSTVSNGIGIFAREYDYGSQLVEVSYQIVRDFTPYFSWPEPFNTDQSPQIITRQALRSIDNDFRNYGAQTFSIPIFDSGTNVYVGDGSKVAVTIPAFMNLYKFTDAIASVYDKGVTGTTTVQVRRYRDGTSTDLLNPEITIGDEYYANDGTADTTVHYVRTGDQIYIDVDTIHTTPPKGLSVTLSFKKG